MKKKEFLKKTAALLFSGLFVFACACGKNDASATDTESSVSVSDSISIPLYELSVAEDSCTVAEKETAELKVIFTENGTNADRRLLKFVSSDSRVAQVDENGVVTGKKEGRCFIKINYGDLNAQVTVKVTKAIVSEIRLNKEKYELIEGTDSASRTQVVARLFVDDKEMTEEKILFEVEDASIAEIDGSGELRAKRAGKTFLKAVSGNVGKRAEIVVYAVAASEQVNSFDEEYINRYGRIYRDGGLKIDHVASGVELAFYGTQLTAELEVSGEVYGRIFVDGDKEGTFTALRTGNKVVLVDGLTEGCHTVRLLKSCELTDGQLKLKGFSAERFLKMPEKADFKIEFIGDSITTGYGALGTSAESRRVENSDACRSFAYYTAQELNADFSMIALQGICVNVHMWQAQYKMSELYKYVTPFKTEEYDFSDAADVVVLNLGTNEATYLGQKDGGYADLFAEDYANFLKFIRSKRSNAKIVCVYGMMGRNEKIHSGIQNAIKNLNDKNITYFFDFSDNRQGAGSHPSETAHRKAGENLADYLSVLCSR